MKVEFQESMIRPCFLVVDREYASSISTRKLVLETAKYNVITSYSCAEAVETLALYPAVTGIVLDGGVRDMPHDVFIDRLKELAPRAPIVIVGFYDQLWHAKGDHFVESFEPAKLLELLKSLTPKETKVIEMQNESLNKQ